MSDVAAGAAGGSRTGLKHLLAHYVPIYGKSERTLKRWREGEDAPPLDDPEGMIAWWVRNFTQKVPDGLNLAVIEHRKRTGTVPMELPLVTEPARARGPEKREEAAPAVVPVEVVVPEGRGLEVELARLEDLAAFLSARARDPGQAKAYLDTVARIMALQAKLREEGEKSGRLVPKDLVQAALVDLHAPIAGGVRALFRTMCELLGLPGGPELEERWNAVCDELFERLGEEVLP